jgi:hypothetical protein
LHDSPSRSGIDVRRLRVAQISRAHNFQSVYGLAAWPSGWRSASMAARPLTSSPRAAFRSFHARRADDEDEPMGVADPLVQFTERLDVEVDMINEFYMDRIEEGVIILHAMAQQVDALIAHDAANAPQIGAIQRTLVSYHFNLLMLQNYVALNFSGVVKILKKLDKKLGTSHRKAYLESIVELPFYNCAALDAAMSEASARLRVPCSLPGVGEAVDTPGLQTVPQMV